MLQDYLGIQCRLDCHLEPLSQEPSAILQNGRVTSQNRGPNEQNASAHDAHYRMVDRSKDIASVSPTYIQNPVNPSAKGFAQLLDRNLIQKVLQSME
jgi:hypothetical protein